MAERRAGHHRQRHGGDAARHPDMLGREPVAQPDPRQPHRDKTQRGQPIARVQHRHQRLGQGALPAPAGKPPEIGRPGDQAEQRRHQRRGRGDPDGQRRQGRSQRHLVRAAETGVAGRQTRAHQPVAGEAGRYAPADHQDHQHRRRQPQAQTGAFGGKPAAQGRQVEPEVAQHQRPDQHQDLEVAPVLPGDDLAGQHRGQRDQEGEVDADHPSRGQPSRQRHRDAPGQPQGRQRRHRPADHRHPPGPVRHRGQQEARHHRAGIAPEELVRVPRDRIERQRQAEAPGQHRDPERHGQHRPEAGEQEKQPEADGQHRRAAPGAHLLCGCHG